MVRIKSNHREKEDKLFIVMVGSIAFLKWPILSYTKSREVSKNIVKLRSLIKYGLGVEQIADVLERDVRTIEGWVEGIAEKSQKFHEFICVAIALCVSKKTE